MINTRVVRWGVALAALVFFFGANLGCAGLRRGPAVPKDLQDRAIVPGLPDVRTWGDYVSPAFRDNVFAALQRKRAHWVATGHAEHPPAGTGLAVSGGGANGAFGAGLLCGWTEKGDRPEFEIVTGISTGALIAPFAFLGPEYDSVLREVYTSISTSSILRERGLLGALTSDALSDNEPLWKLLAKYVDEALLDAVAAEYEEGRLLLIGTVNLDSRRSVIWNIGAIAASDDPKALGLVRSILIASASIPAAFPPVMIDVEVDGRNFQEMHVDGGCLNEVFLYPTSFVPLEVRKAARVERERRLYVIRNSRVDPDWAEVERQTLSIAERAISALIHSQGLGDLNRMFMTARRDGMEFNLACIPADFEEVPQEPFDRGYMRKLFDVGFELARGGYPWSKTPPGYVELDQP
jgi:hypothetical protein